MTDEAPNLRSFLPGARKIKDDYDEGLISPRAYKDRCKMELSSWRQIRTTGDVIGLNEAVINSCIAGVIETKQASTLGYLSLIQLQAIRQLGQTGGVIGNQLDERLMGDNVELEATEEELKALSGAPTREVQIKLINRFVSRTTIDTKTIEQYVPEEAQKPIKAVMKQIKMIEKEQDTVDAEVKNE